MAIFLLATGSWAKCDDAISFKGREFSCKITLSPPSVAFTKLVTNKSDLLLEAAQDQIIHNPERFFVDLPNFHILRTKQYPVSGDSLIKGVRTGQQPTGARVVLDLAAEAHVVRHISKDVSRISFDLLPGADNTAVQPVSEPTPTPVPAQPVAIQIEPTKKAAPGAQIVSVARINLEPTVPLATPTIAMIATPVDLQLSFSGDVFQPEKLLKFSVDANFISLEPGERPLRDLTVINKTENPIYLYAVVHEVFDAGTPHERFEATKALLASPRRFELPPLASRMVRLVLASKSPEEGEEIFRVSLYPQETPFGESEVEGSINQVPATVMVIAGIGVIVTAPSKTAEGLIDSKATESEVKFSNTGNRTVAFNICSRCPMDTAECSSLPRKLLFPGAVWTVPTSGKGVITCNLKLGRDSNRLTVPYG